MKNREIKFRGWNTNRHDWEDLENLDCMEFNSTIGMLQQEGVVLQQYTGLKDANSKEIYEGDIVLGKNKQRGVIEWIKLDTAFAVQTNKAEIFTVGKFSALAGGVEVIGNCFENPELLGGD